jgi:hypothetical protein
MPPALPPPPVPPEPPASLAKVQTYSKAPREVPTCAVKHKELRDSRLAAVRDQWRHLAAFSRDRAAYLRATNGDAGAIARQEAFAVQAEAWATSGSGRSECADRYACKPPSSWHTCRHKGKGGKGHSPAIPDVPTPFAVGSVVRYKQPGKKLREGTVTAYDEKSGFSTVETEGTPVSVFLFHKGVKAELGAHRVSFARNR